MTYVIAYVKGMARKKTSKKEKPRTMSSMNASEARRNLYRLIDAVTEDHTPIIITGKRSSAVLVSEDDWSSIQETLHLMSIPGMRESIRKGMDTPAEEMGEDPGW